MQQQGGERRQEGSWSPLLAAGEIPHGPGGHPDRGRQVQTEEFQEGPEQHLGGQKVGCITPPSPLRHPWGQTILGV